MSYYNQLTLNSLLSTVFYHELLQLVYYKHFTTINLLSTAYYPQYHELLLSVYNINSLLPSVYYQQSTI